MLDFIALCFFLLMFLFLLEFLMKGTEDAKNSELLFSLIEAALCMFIAFLIIFLK